MAAPSIRVLQPLWFLNGAQDERLEENTLPVQKLLRGSGQVGAQKQAGGAPFLKR